MNKQAEHIINGKQEKSKSEMITQKDKTSKQEYYTAAKQVYLRLVNQS